MWDDEKPVDSLTDKEKLEFIGDLPGWELHLVTQLRIESEALEVPFNKRAAEIIQANSPSLMGKRAGQMVEAMRARAEDQDPNSVVDMPSGSKPKPEDSGGSSGGGFFSGWKI